MSRAAPTSQHQSHQHRDTAPRGGEALFAAANAACSAPKLSTLAGDTLANTTVGSDDRCLDGLDGSPCPPLTAKMTAPCPMAMTMLNAKRNSAGSFFPKSCVLD